MAKTVVGRQDVVVSTQVINETCVNLLKKASEISSSVFRAVPLLVDFPAQRFWVSYDREADVLYISFQRPQKATDTKMTESRFISTTVDEVYQAMRNNPGLPNKDEFVQKLNTRLQARLSVQFSSTSK